VELQLALPFERRGDLPVLVLTRHAGHVERVAGEDSVTPVLARLCAGGADGLLRRGQRRRCKEQQRRRDAGLQHSDSETASPPSEVSLYLPFISFAVSAIASTVESKSTRRLTGISLVAIAK